MLLNVSVTRIKTNLLKWSAHNCCVCSKLQSALMLCIIHGSRRKVRIVVIILCGLIFKTLATSLAIRNWVYYMSTKCLVRNSTFSEVLCNIT